MITIYSHHRKQKTNAIGIQINLIYGKMEHNCRLWVNLIRQRLIMLIHKHGTPLIPLRQEYMVLSGSFIINGVRKQHKVAFSLYLLKVHQM